MCLALYLIASVGLAAVSAASPREVEHCAEYDSVSPQNCIRCDDNFFLASRQECKPVEKCSDKVPTGCSGCSEPNGEICVQCLPDYELSELTNRCYAVCPIFGKEGTKEEYTHGCLRCKGESCEVCDLTSYYWTSEYGGSCIYQGCAREIRADGAVVCAGHGKCEPTERGRYVCNCDSEDRKPSDKCECAPGVKEDASGKCVVSNCPPGLYPECKACTITGGSAICSECVEGYYNTSMMCRIPMPPGCQAIYSYSRGCGTCQEGYSKEWDAPACYPVVNLTAEQQDAMPNCAWVDNQGKCTLCKYGYMNPESNCDLECEAGPFCARCDTKEPGVCTQCIYGSPEHCIPVAPTTCDSKTFLDTSGKCVSRNCLSIDFGYYGHYYGTTTAFVACSGNGVCNEDGANGAACSCKPNYDPANNCFSCLPGFVKNATTGECVKNENICPENCGSCAHGICTSCRAGWSNIANGCDTPCSTPGCNRCSPSDPTDCLTCVLGSGQGQYKVTPPCMPLCDGSTNYCDMENGDEGYCAFDSKGTSVCIPEDCAANAFSSGTPATVCNHGGTCVDGGCVCDEKHSGFYCTSCARGYQEDSITGECVKLPAEGCTGCFPHELCIMVHGEPECMSRYCVSGGEDSCNNAGECLPSGVCKCNGGEHFNATTACVKCNDGYSLEDGKCVPNTCVSGANKVLGCKECLFEGSRICKTCEGDTMPTGDNHCLDIPPPPSANGLSAGAIAGIIIAAVLVVALVVFLICWFMCRKSKKAAPRQAITDSPAPNL